MHSSSVMPNETPPGSAKLNLAAFAVLEHVTTGVVPRYASLPERQEALRLRGVHLDQVDQKHPSVDCQLVAAESDVNPVAHHAQQSLNAIWHNTKE